MILTNTRLHGGEKEKKGNFIKKDCRKDMSNFKAIAEV